MQHFQSSAAYAALTLTFVLITGCGELETAVADPMPMPEAFFTGIGIPLGNGCFDVGETGVTVSLDGTQVFGTKGPDIIDCSYNETGVTIHGGKGNDNLTGGHGNDVIKGGFGDDMLCGGYVGVVGPAPCYEPFPYVEALDGDDILEGGQGDDPLLYGGSQNDLLKGGQGDDVLIGGEGNDDLEGGQGDDTLTDTAGNNTCDGGKGANVVNCSP